MPEERIVYGSLLIQYNVGNNSYYIIDMNYACSIGTLNLSEGPGWVFRPVTTFLDWSDLQTIADLVADLNQELSDG